jgi:hypothetical protein
LAWSVTTAKPRPSLSSTPSQVPTRESTNDRESGHALPYFKIWMFLRITASNVRGISQWCHLAGTRAVQEAVLAMEYHDRPQGLNLPSLFS